MPTSHRLRAIILLPLATLASAAVVAQAPVPGEKWRTTTSMEMEGMTLPAQTRETCVPTGKAAEALSAPTQDNCEVYDVTRGSNRFAAKVRCSGKDAFEGTIEQLADGPDKYRGTMKMRSADGDEMTMRIASAKLPGACDAAAEERRMNAILAKAQGDANKMQAEQCRASAAELEKSPGAVAGVVQSYFPAEGSPAICKDTRERTTVCSALATRAGFTSMRDAEKTYYKETAGFSYQRYLDKCSLGTVDAVRTKLIAEAEQVGAWGFLHREAPQVVDAIVKRECAGRRYSRDIAPTYRSLCGWAATAAAGDNSAPADASSTGSDNSTATAAATPQDKPPATAGDKAKDVTNKAKKALRGIFGGS